MYLVHRNNHNQPTHSYNVPKSQAHLEPYYKELPHQDILQNGNGCSANLTNQCSLVDHFQSQLCVWMD